MSISFSPLTHHTVPMHIIALHCSSVMFKEPNCHFYSETFDKAHGGGVKASLVSQLDTPPLFNRLGTAHRAQIHMAWYISYP